MKVKLLFIVFLLLQLGCESKSQKAKEIFEVEGNSVLMKPTSHTLTTIDNKKIDFKINNKIIESKQLNGKVVLINFFATWCQPCIEEIETFNKLQEKYRDDFLIISVLFKDSKTKEELKNFIKKHTINFIVTLGKGNDILAKELDNVQMIPESFLYSPDGFLLEKFVGEVEEEKLENYIKQSMNSAKYN